MNLLEKIWNENVSDKDKIQGVLKYDSDGVALYNNDRVLIRINFGKIDIHQYQPTEFITFLVKGRNYYESDATCIEFGRERIGWAFPILTLKDREHLPDGKWPRIYADYALNAIITNETIYQYSRNILVKELNQCFSIEQLFPEDYIVIILGKNEVESNHINNKTIEILLMKFMYLPIMNNRDKMSIFESVDRVDDVRIRLEAFSADLIDVQDKIRFLISEAIYSVNTCTAFLLLYQIIETLIAMVFKELIHAYQCNPKLLENPWLVVAANFL